MKRIFLLLIFLSSYITKAQEQEELSKKGEWFESTYIGNVNIESNNFKNRASVIGANIGKSFLINSNINLLAGVEFQKLNYNNFSENLGNVNAHNDITFIKTPFTFRYLSNQSGKSRIYVDITVYASHLTKSKIYYNGKEESTKNLGTNFGAGFGFGLSHEITEKLSFKVGFIGQSDLFENYKNKNNLIKLKDLYAINLGIGFQL